MDVIASSLEFLQSTIQNNPTKELVQILKDDMQHSREQEMRQFNMLCDLIRSNQSHQVPFTDNSDYNAQAIQTPHLVILMLQVFTPHIYYYLTLVLLAANLFKQSHLPFSQQTTTIQGIKAPTPLHLLFS